MTDDQLTTLLDRLGRDIDVSPAPMPELLETGGRLRRRHSALRIAGATTAVAALTVAGGLIARDDAPTPNVAKDVGNTAAAGGPLQAAPVSFPPNTRLVGVNNAIIAVPESWSTNEAQCGTPQANTVVINTSWYASCVAGRPDGVASLEVRAIEALPSYPDFGDATETRIDGAAALLTPQVCGASDLPSSLCTQSLYIESQDAFFQVQAHEASVIDDILGSVHVVTDMAGVPVSDNSDLGRQTGAAFIAAAEALGLQVDVAYGHRPPLREGEIIDVQPPTGTVLEPGDTVHVTLMGATTQVSGGTH